MARTHTYHPFTNTGIWGAVHSSVGKSFAMHDNLGAIHGMCVKIGQRTNSAELSSDFHKHAVARTQQHTVTVTVLLL